jgi:hypothetical protein
VLLSRFKALAVDRSETAVAGVGRKDEAKRRGVDRSAARTDKPLLAPDAGRG